MKGFSPSLVTNGMDQPLVFIDEAYLKKEREKARKLKSSQWWKRKRSSGICHYCKQVFPPGELTMDHIIPLSRGGRTEKFNVAVCCKECNTKKRKFLPSEWEGYMMSLK